MKRTLAIAILVLVGLWPLAHRVLVARYGSSPWKLGAFAMYATPTLPVLIGLFRKEDEQLILIDEHELPAHAARVLDRFRRERVALGRLRGPPDEVADAVLLALPDVDLLVVLEQRIWLDRETARIASEKEHFVYRRVR